MITGEQFRAMCKKEPARMAKIIQNSLRDSYPSLTAKETETILKKCLAGKKQTDVVAILIERYLENGVDR